jgi:hypothetical protein
MVFEFSSLHVELFARIWMEWCNFCITHSIFRHGKSRGFSVVSVIDGICFEIL